MIVVGWGFKGTRFAAHSEGLPFLENGIEYIGVNNPPRASLEAALAGELDKLQSIVSGKDWLLAAPKWQAQRDQRNPLNVKHPYDDEVAAYLR